MENIHLNGNGTLHGGVYASLLDNAMGLSVAALVGLRTATIGLDVHFLGAVREGRITCSAEVVHRTRRIATVEARVRDGEGNLVAWAQEPSASSRRGATPSCKGFRLQALQASGLRSPLGAAIYEGTSHRRHAEPASLLVRQTIARNAALQHT